jgi:ABC-2 type transport system ATP-binding protein
MLELVDLPLDEERMVGAYSSGMKQRLLIARALLARPAVLLLDEPTRSLDPISAREMRRFLREEIVDTHGCTVLLATHNTDEVVDLCDEVGVLHRGRLLAQGRVSELSDRFGDRQYVLRSGGDAEAVLQELEERGALAQLERSSLRGSWATFEMVIPGGPAGASEVLERLVGAGIPVASLDRMPVPLADLLERVISKEGGGALG